MYFEWDPKYSVQVDEIDEQHKKLFEAINSFIQAVSNGFSEMKIEETITFLNNYTSFHFGTEEKYMKEYDYPELEEHLSLHDTFNNNLQTLTEDFHKNGPTKQLSVNINHLLVNWLVNHILHVDIKLGIFLKNKIKNTPHVI